MDEYRALTIVADFSTLLSTYFKGFTVIIEPYPDDNIIYDPLMQFYCLDASLATKPLFAKYRNVILTSGTISPIEMYPKILDFTPKVMKAFDIALPRNAIQPLIVTRGADLLPISSRFEDRENAGNIRNYGNLLVELS
jgi:DNA excision repair protein ERCC-2